jgi:hypothetical protein
VASANRFEGSTCMAWPSARVGITCCAGPATPSRPTGLTATRLPS